MKRSCAALAVLLALAGPVGADEMDVETLLEDAKPFGDRWERCAALAAKRELRSNRPPEDVARRALGRCGREERALLGVLRKEIGGKRAEAVVALVRNIYEVNLSRAVAALRAR